MLRSEVKVKVKKSFLAIICIILSMNFAHADSAKKIKIYMAAGLFNGRENQFNLVMTKEIEKRGYQAILPLREGFEDKAFSAVANKYMSSAEVRNAERNLVYLRDIGIFIPESDVILANLDEPLDEGVIIEMTYAHIMGKMIIGYRTDERSRYVGSEGVSGIHSFVALQCDFIVTQSMMEADDKQMMVAITTLINKIDHIIKSEFPKHKSSGSAIDSIIKTAHLLIKKPKDMQTEAGLLNAVELLRNNKDKLRSIRIEE